MFQVCVWCYVWYVYGVTNSTQVYNRRTSSSTTTFYWFMWCDNINQSIAARWCNECNDTASKQHTVRDRERQTERERAAETQTERQWHRQTDRERERDVPLPDSLEDAVNQITRCYIAIEPTSSESAIQLLPKSAVLRCLLAKLIVPLCV